MSVFVLFFVEKEEEELKLQALNKVEEEGVCMVNKLDPKWSDEEDKMQSSSNLTPPSMICKATQETFMQRSDLVWKSHKTKSIQVLPTTKYNSWILNDYT